MNREPIDNPTSEFPLSNMAIKVLLIDDQAFIGKMVNRMMDTEKDIQFHFCQNARMAIHMANKIDPTVILQDLTMPEVDGLSMVRYYRMNKNTQKTPLIMLSGQEDAKVKADAFALGANDYIVKPPDKIELIARIRYHSQAYINMLQRDAAYIRLKEQSAELEIRNKFIKKTFGRYLSDDIVKSILDTPEGLELGGEKRKVTIMMTDLRGFTSLSERLAPEQVLDIINNYLGLMTEIIFKYQGTIDEFIGDAILTIFGAPVSHGNDAQRAVACAIEMQNAMDDVNKRNIESGYPEISMGIGINTGEVVVGNIGSEKRSKYGVIGSNVNLTSRIESYTIGGQILVSESTLNACGPILRVDDQIEVMPKGVKEPINIYDIGGIGGEYDIHIPDRIISEMIELDTVIPILFTILEGKHAGIEQHGGTIVKIGPKEVIIHSTILPDIRTNIKLTIYDDKGFEVTSELYGKVIEHFEQNHPQLRVNLTSIPPEVDVFFKTTIDSN